MTLNTTTYGYLERPYLNEDDQYLTGEATGALGMQATFVIQKNAPQGMQALFSIQDFLDRNGMQAEFIIEALKRIGMQSQFTINDSDPNGMQAEFIPSVSDANGMQSLFEIADQQHRIAMQTLFLVEVAKRLGMQSLFIPADNNETGIQSEFNIIDFKAPKGMEAKFDKLFHRICEGYLEGDYLSDAYLTGLMCAHMGMQAEFKLGVEDPQGMQSQFVINDDDKIAMQSLFIIDAAEPMGMQVEMINNTPFGMQALFALYNTTNLRILCDFPSRGAETGAGLNAWGNAIASGLNWNANSTEPGDFEEFRLNTDVVEEYWRSATGTKTGINLDCDTEIAQGVFLDTLAILGHNMTTSASLTIIGSNDPTFSSIGITIVPIVQEENIYWVSPELPTAGFRYWRFQISDPTNPEAFIKIGTILFGASQIFQGECFVDEVEFELKDFADTVNTAGHTNVANSRAIKRNLILNFRSLKFNRANFRTLRGLFQESRTVLKCLWIPTPSVNNVEYLSRFAVFAKLVKIPREVHNVKGPDSDFVSLTIELDESQ